MNNGLDEDPTDLGFLMIRRIPSEETAEDPGRMFRSPILRL